MEQNGNKCFFVILALLAVGLIYLLSPILTPFLLAGLLAYLGNPLVNKLMRMHLPRIACVAIVFLLIFSLLGFAIVSLVPLVQKQITLLAQWIPKVIDWLQTKVLPLLTAHLGEDFNLDVNSLKTTLMANWSKAGSWAAWLLQEALHSGYTFLSWLTDLVLVPVVTFYLLRDWNKVLNGFRDLLPRAIEPTVVMLAKECDHVLGAFLRGQMLVMLCLGTIYSIGLSIVGLQIGLIIGMVAGLVSIVPYLGFIVGVTSSLVAAYLQFGTWEAMCSVLIVFAIGQMMESMVLTPKLVGPRIGLHPVAVIFAILTGGKLFGFFGVLLALPVASVVMVLVRYLNGRYHGSHLYRA